jgi:hypothetical protein
VRSEMATATATATITTIRFIALPDSNCTRFTSAYYLRSTTNLKYGK